ncbi:hypothetical protein GQ457_01G027720 [Hibiscus cannabinus]
MVTKAVRRLLDSFLTVFTNPSFGSKIVTWYQSLDDPGSSLWISSSGSDLENDNQNEGYQGYHTAVSSGNNQKVDTPVQVFTHTLSPMSASPQQMVYSGNSGFNVSVPTQGVLMSHLVSGSMHQMTPMHVSQGGSSHASSHAASSPTTPTTYVTTSSQWPAISDGAWYPDTGPTHHVTNDSANLQAGTVYTGNRRLLMGNGDGVLISQIGQGSLYTNGRSLVLQNLLHVPLFKKNLLESNLPLVVSSKQQCVHVSQQPRVTELGGGSSGCHSDSHIQDETRHSNDVQEGLQESGFSESQQQSLEESQQQAQVDVQDSDIGIQNDDVGEDSVQVSPGFSVNDIYEEGSQGDNAVQDEFQDDLQTGNEMQPVDIMEPDGDDGGNQKFFMFRLLLNQQAYGKP